MTTTRAVRRGSAGLVAALLTATMVIAATAEAPAQARPTATANQAKARYRLTLLHNNDGESQLIDAGSGLEDFGGVARFAAKVAQEKAAAATGKRRGVLLVSSGDNFLAGPEFNASLEKGRPYYDAIAMNRMGYDAIAIGNHDFDFGPDVLADFIRSFRDPVPFLSANLNFKGEPSLQKLFSKKRIAKHVIVEEDNQRFGIIGATTPLLPHISSPRNVKVRSQVATIIQNQVNNIHRKGVNKVILISHLQSIEEDLALAPLLHGIDIMVAGGGDELLANEDDVLVPGDEEQIFGEYPLIAQDSAGRDVPVVTTKGSYTYLGKLVVKFNRRGHVTSINDGSGPIRIAGGDEPDAVAPNNFVMTRVVEPVIAAIEALANNVIGTSEVVLDGRRSQVRTTETNEGNLATDALLWQAEQLAGDFGVPAPDVALQNGGGIRNDSEIPAGNITELHTFDMLPFPNFVSIVPEVSRETFEDILENAVSNVENVDGRFAQIAGFSFTYDAAAQPRTIDPNTGAVTPGERVLEVTLDDGTAIVQGGAVVAGPALHVATIDFLARGGDQYPYGDADFTTLGVTYQQSLANYIVDALSGQITAADYPVGGEGRITRLN
jgi:2',3'-cyclic-nucleotide 2'-phosphodiesterase (5'-nucleotidase family)